MSHRMIRVESSVYERLQSLRARPGEPIAEVVSRLTRAAEAPASQGLRFDRLVEDLASRWAPSEAELDRLDALQATSRTRRRNHLDDEGLE